MTKIEEQCKKLREMEGNWIRPMESRIQARRRRQEIEGEPQYKPFEVYEAMHLSILELKIKVSVESGEISRYSMFYKRLKALLERRLLAH